MRGIIRKKESITVWLVFVKGVSRIWMDYMTTDEKSAKSYRPINKRYRVFCIKGPIKITDGKAFNENP